jgi:hypothetical protein
MSYSKNPNEPNVSFDDDFFTRSFDDVFFYSSPNSKGGDDFYGSPPSYVSRKGNSGIQVGIIFGAVLVLALVIILFCKKAEKDKATREVRGAENVAVAVVAVPMPDNNVENVAVSAVSAVAPIEDIENGAVVPSVPVEDAENYAVVPTAKAIVLPSAPSAPTAEPPTAASTPSERLRYLERVKYLLSKEEYERKRAEIVASI